MFRIIEIPKLMVHFCYLKLDSLSSVAMDDKELDACIETWKITKSVQKLVRGRPFTDHLTLEWGGGGGWLLVIKNFFSNNLLGRIFFPFFPISFLLHLYCMQFFSSDKRLQEFFLQNNPPPPSRVNWSAPYEIWYYTCTYINYAKHFS